MREFQEGAVCRSEMGEQWHTCGTQNCMPRGTAWLVLGILWLFSSGCVVVGGGGECASPSHGMPLSCCCFGSGVVGSGAYGRCYQHFCPASGIMRSDELIRPPRRRSIAFIYLYSLPPY